MGGIMEKGSIIQIIMIFLWAAAVMFAIHTGTMDGNKKEKKKGSKEKPSS
jgi:hypothetical protein